MASMPFMTAKECPFSPAKGGGGGGGGRSGWGVQSGDEPRMETLWKVKAKKQDFR